MRIILTALLLSIFVTCRTALMLAALGCHTDCVHILLEKGAKADAADKKGFTALHRAVSVFAVHVWTSPVVINQVTVPLRSSECSTCFLLPCIMCSPCRPCWAVRAVYQLCWNMGPLLCIETLRERLRCTSRHLSATQRSSDICLKLLWKLTLWTPYWTTGASHPRIGLPTTVRNRGKNSCKISFFCSFFLFVTKRGLFKSKQSTHGHEGKQHHVKLSFNAHTYTFHTFLWWGIV